MRKAPLPALVVITGKYILLPQINNVYQDSQESHELILIEPQGLKYIAPSTRTSLQHPHPATAPSSQATQELNLIKPQWLKLYNTRTSTQRPHQHPAPAPSEGPLALPLGRPGVDELVKLVESAGAGRATAARAPQSVWEPVLARCCSAARCPLQNSPNLSPYTFPDP